MQAEDSDHGGWVQVPSAKDAKQAKRMERKGMMKPSLGRCCDGLGVCDAAPYRTTCEFCLKGRIKKGDRIAFCRDHGVCVCARCAFAS